MDRLSYLNFAFSVAENQLRPEGAKILAEMLRVSTSMNKLNVLSNSIGDEGYEILTKVAEENGIFTLVGFDEGQTEADLSWKSYEESGEKLGPIDAKLIARELTTGYVSSSMKSLNLADNRLCGIKVYSDGSKKGNYDPAGIKEIADALSVSSSMTSLK